MYNAVNSLFFQEFLQPVSFFAPNHKLMPDCCCILTNLRQFYSRIPDVQQIRLTYLRSFSSQFRQMLQLNPEQSGLYLIQSGVCSHNLIVISFLTAIITKNLNFFRKPGIIGDNRARISECSQVFRRIKGKAAYIAKSSRHPPSKTSAMRLCAIFYNLQIIFFGYFADLIHLCRLSIQMDNQYSLCFLRNLFFNFGCINIKVFIRLYHNRSSAIDADSHHTCNIRISLNNNLITLSDPQNTKSNPQRVQAACQACAILCSQIVCELFFKGFQLLPENIPP